MSSRYVNSSHVLAKFVMNDNSVNCYPEQVQYYFTHIVDLPEGSYKHYLAFIRWYRPKLNMRYHFSANNTCNVEL